MVQNTLKNSISRRTSFILSIVVTVIFLLTSAIFISDHVTTANHQMLQKLEATTRLAETSLVSVIWHLDISAINNVLEAIIADENITLVSLTVDDEIISKRVQPEYAQYDFDYFINKSGYIVQTTDIQYLGTKIGRFQIVLTRQKIDERLVFEISIIITVSILTMIFIFFLMLFISRRYILNPLSKLEHSAMQIADGKLEMSDWTSFPLIDKEDEFGVLSRAFNKMIQQLKYNIDTLDIQVMERTMELKEAKEKAEKAAQSKTEFLTTMSHEIRTPLNTICGMTEMLNDTPLSKQQQHYSKTLTSSSELLLSIINDILDFSKIDSEQIELESIPFELSDLIDSVNSILVTPAQEKGLELINWLDTDVSNLRLGDFTRLHQILINLLGNAIKFTKKGEVILEIVNHPDTHKSDWIKIHVRDTGIGIPEDKQQEIFEHFSQADMSTTRKYGGTGLGLAISKKLVEMMGGQISVNSNIGQGTEFIFDVQLPVAEALLPEEKQTLAHQQKSDQSAVDPAVDNEDSAALVGDHPTIRILLAEDIKTNWELIQYYLNDFPVKLDIVTNGLQAVSKYKQNSYDLILMDIQMPKMDGYAATAAIRLWENENDLPRIPVIAITAHAFKQQREKCIEVGCDYFLSKPVTKKSLIKIISELSN
jgi:signal transduction histidine kinase/CheY-like chemotaxis protein